MKVTKEMIEAVKYMAKTGKCDKVSCFDCPFVDVCGSNITPNKKDEHLELLAKNWLKENTNE